MTVPGVIRNYVDYKNDRRVGSCPGVLDYSVRLADYIPDGASPFFDRHLFHRCYPGLDDRGPPEVHYLQKDWRPLVSLLTRLPCLTEIHYAVGNIFPECLLQVIHDHHPTCQLSIWSEQAFSLKKPGLGPVYAHWMQPQFEETFDAMMNVLRSPCLNAIKLLYLEGTRSNGHVLDLSRVIQQEEIIPLVAMAPNLKHIFLQARHVDRDELWTSTNKWRDFVSSIQRQPSAYPISLSFKTAGPPINRSLATWARRMDLSSVRSLDIYYILDFLQFQDTLSGFPHLERLFINVAQGLRQVPLTFRDEVKSLFENLSPLKHIHIRGSEDKDLIYEILKRHGQTLKGLIIQPLLKQWSVVSRRVRKYHLYPEFDHYDIAAFAELCPHLKELRIPIRRSKGDQNECRIYQALGKFPCLERLVLDLDCDFRVKSDRDADTRNMDYEQIADAFVNAAMDETLAQAIWALVFRSQKRKELRHLRVTPFGGDVFGQIAFTILFQISRCFLISRNGYYVEAELEVMEIGREDRELYEERLAQFNTRRKLGTPWAPELLRVLMSLWPSIADIPDWSHGWKSFPLQASDV